METTEAEHPRPRHGRVPYRLLSLLASAGLLAAGVAIVYNRIDWRSVTTVWANLDPKLVVLAGMIYWLQYPINSFRIHRVILWVTARMPSDVPPLKFLFKLTSSAGFVSVAAPIGLAGDAAKIAALRMFGSLSLTDAARCALFDRVVGVQWICIIGLASLPFQTAAGVSQNILMPELAIFAGLIAAVGVLLVLPRALNLIRNDFIDRLARVFVGYRSILSPQRSLIQLAIAAANLFCAWGALYLLLRAAGLGANGWLVAGFIPLLQLVNGLPFLYMGWGGREIAMATTLGAASSLTINETLAVSVAWGVVIVVTGAVNGLFLLGDWQVTGQSASDGGHNTARTE